MTTRLQLYNGALLLAGDRALSGLTEAREPRYLLDQVWDGGGVKYCLEQGQWHFAMRTSELDYNPSITPDFGFQRAFDKPTDWVATSGVFQDEYTRVPLTQYADEISYWFADLDVIYVKYVSNNSTYGGDLSRWPSSFADYAMAYFASKIIHKLPGGAANRTFLLGPEGHPNRGWLHQCLLIAKNKAAMTQPATFPTRGTWARARHHGMNHNWDGGNPNQLIG